MHNDSKEIFEGLCREAHARDLTTLDCTEVEPLLVEILKLVKARPEERQTFVELFLAVDAGTIDAPMYLIPFCMRELKFPEIRERLYNECEHEQGTERFVRRMNYISDVFHAYDDPVWEDAVMWPYYAFELQHNQPPHGGNVGYEDGGNES
jgi:hypothetical protein